MEKDKKREKKKKEKRTTTTTTTTNDMSLVKGSSSEDFFRSLTNGARFNKSKNDVKMFSNRGKPEKHTIKTLSTKQKDQELHYKTSKKKTIKEPEPEEKIEDDEEYDDDFIEEEEEENNESTKPQISLFSDTLTTATTTAPKKATGTNIKIKDAITPATIAAEGAKRSKKDKKKQKAASSVTSILLTQMNLAPAFQAQIESIERVHRLNGIKVSGNDIVAPIEHFSELRERLPGIDPRVLRNLRRHSIEDPSPIQMQAIPSMGLGREVIGVAPTGSGKTLAYVLPLIHLLTSKMASSDASIMTSPADPAASGKRGYRSIVLSPTRELAQQIYRVFKRYCEGIRMRVCLLTRGIMDKKATLPKGAFDVLVATPLRLVNMIKDGSVDLSGVQTLVLDEADRLFDEQFVGQIDEIAAACKEARERVEGARALQVCLFSATMLPQVEQLAASIMRDPVRILVGHRNVPLRSIRQSLVFCGNEEGKLLKMVSMVREGAVRVPCLVFVQSKERGSELRRLLAANGVRNVVDINADKSEGERARIVDDFRVGKIWFLISTEIMARGMDFPGICSVINYDFPQSNASYVHRVGRTGRGTSVDGTAFTFFTETDAGFLRTIANSVKAAGCDVPDWMLELKPLDKAQRKRLERVAPKRINVGGAADKKNGPANFKVDYDSLTNREKALVVRSGAKRPRKGNGDDDDDDGGLAKKMKKRGQNKKWKDGKKKKEKEEEKEVEEVNSDEEDDEQ